MSLIKFLREEIAGLLSETNSGEDTDYIFLNYQNKQMDKNTLCFNGGWC